VISVISAIGAKKVAGEIDKLPISTFSSISFYLP
jgi:hypothetical protein